MGAPGSLLLYLIRRLMHGLLVLAGVSVLSFAFVTLAPGDLLSEMRLNPQISRETVLALRDHYGLDRPLPQQYGLWLQSVARGELGFSFAYNSPVAALLWPRARNTLLLTVPATFLAWLIAVPVGAWSASRRGEWVDRLAAGTTTALLIVPELLLALALMLLAVRTGWFPIGGMTSAGFDRLGAWGRAGDLAVHLVLPITALILLTLPVLIRHVRSSLVDALAAPFIQATRARGVPPGRLVFRDALRAAANPLISLLGLSVAGLLSTSLVVEAVMSWPGLGPLLLDAVAARDLHLVIGAVMCSTLLLLAGNLIADTLLYVADPRIRADRV
jgi:peptide/nickel transport system permease protein